MCSSNPTPTVDYESVVDFEWPQVNDTEHMSYLDIDGNFTVQTNPEAKRVKFWNWLYDNYVDKQETSSTNSSNTTESTDKIVVAKDTEVTNTTEATNTTKAANTTEALNTTEVANTTEAANTTKAANTTIVANDTEVANTTEAANKPEDANTTAVNK